MHATASLAESDWIGRRQPQPSAALMPATILWMAGLPAKLRPRLLPVDYTRVANAIAACWNEPAACCRYMDELTVDYRGNRSGFPIAVIMEIAALKNFYETVLHPVPQTVWDDLISRHREL